MTSSELLAQAAERLWPGYLTRCDWGEIWKRPLSKTNGAPLEWAMLAALATQATTLGWSCSWPALDLPDGNILFPLRNAIPLHHGAQPGHAGSEQANILLQERFLQAFIPKLVLQRGESHFSVFREGCPYHRVMGDASYDERPDIAFLAGRPTPGFPRVIENGAMMEFSFDLKGGLTVSGRLRIRNSPVIPLQFRAPSEGAAILLAGIVECSLNKTAETARLQAGRYEELFGVPPNKPPVILVTGNDLTSLSWPNALVRLSQSDVSVTEADLRAAADLALRSFSIR